MNKGNYVEKSEALVIYLCTLHDYEKMLIRKVIKRKFMFVNFVMVHASNNDEI